jgi:hypothetical protein
MSNRVSNFIEASRTFVFNFLCKKAAKYCEYHKCKVLIDHLKLSLVVCIARTGKSYKIYDTFVALVLALRDPVTDVLALDTS